MLANIYCLRNHVFCEIVFYVERNAIQNQVAHETSKSGWHFVESAGDFGVILICNVYLPAKQYYNTYCKRFPQQQPHFHP